MTDNINWPSILRSPLSRGELAVLLFLTLNLPDDHTSGQSELGQFLGVETRTVNQTLRTLAEKEWITKEKIKGSTVKKISLHPDLKKKWGPRFWGCKICHRIDIPFQAFGLCRKDYFQKIVKQRRIDKKAEGDSEYIHNRLKGRWAMKFDKCVSCGLDNSSPHYIKGKCRRCWERDYRRQYREAGRDRWVNERKK